MERLFLPGSCAAALELLDIWTSVSSKHVSLGTSCACGIGGVTLQLQDFEQDIIDYLSGQAERARRADVGAYVKGHAFHPDTGRASVRLLLTAMSDAAPGADVNPDVAAFLLERLGKTLRSFARLHR